MEETADGCQVRGREGGEEGRRGWHFHCGGVGGEGRDGGEGWGGAEGMGGGGGQEQRDGAGIGMEEIPTVHCTEGIGQELLMVSDNSSHMTFALTVYWFPCNPPNAFLSAVLRCLISLPPYRQGASHHAHPRRKLPVQQQPGHCQA